MKPYFNNSNIPITMKTFKFILLLFLPTFIVSCSSDDDSNNAPKGYFPTRIEKIDFTKANFNRIFVFEYNAQNQIALICATASDGETVT